MSDENSEYRAYGMTWDGKTTKFYIDGERVYIRQQRRYTKARRFVRLLFNRNLRRRLKRWQQARVALIWQDNYSMVGFINRTLTPEEILECFRLSQEEEQS